MTSAVSPSFRTMANMIEEGLVLKPLVEAYLALANFPDRFDITFHKAGEAREPDGWFHPSTHPEWTPRMLYYYLTAPGSMEVESLSYESRMAITMGTAVHGFVEMCIREMGLMVPLTGTCPACGRPHGIKPGECDEYGVADEKMGSRGHMDGILNITTEGRFWKPGIGGLEFKTSNSNASRGLVDLDVESFIKKWPDYYAQVQNYMEVSGLRQVIVLLGILGYPWRFIEYQIEYDPAYSIGLRRKYLAVWDHVAMGSPPDACCAPLSKAAKTCPARHACPIGRLR